MRRVQGIPLAVACAVAVGGCADCEPGDVDIIQPRTCSHYCVEEFRVCLEDGQWSEVLFTISEPMCLSGETRFCEPLVELPEGCCEGHRECDWSEHDPHWEPCQCTDWCDAGTTADALDDPVHDPEDAVDMPTDPDDPDAEDMEDEG